jgi:hypothetical protein
LRLVSDAAFVAKKLRLRVPGARFTAKVRRLLIPDPASGIEQSAFGDGQRRRRHFSGHLCGWTQRKFFTGADLAFHDPIDLRNRNLNNRPGKLRAIADNERAIRRTNASREVSIDSQHRFELHFASKIRDITDETKPIVFGDINPPATFLSSRNRVRAHCVTFVI